MTTLKVRFDGHVLIPQEPVTLPQDCVLDVAIYSDNSQNTPLADLADWAEQLPVSPNSPTDGAAQHDHYLYGTPKRP